MGVNIADFLRKNVETKEKTKEVHFGRFKSPWIIKTISEKENGKLKKAATKYPKRMGGAPEFDNNAYQGMMIGACVVSPPLDNAELQADYGTQGNVADTAREMLLPGEFSRLSEEITELNGFGEEPTVEELKEEVKN